MSTMSKVDGKWVYSNTVASKSGLDSTLKTSGKYLDADIKVEVAVQEGTVEASPASVLALTAGVGDVTVAPSTGLTLSDTPITGGYSITAKGKGTVSATANGSVEITKGGWIDATTVSLSEDSGSLASNEAEKVLYLNKATLTTSEDSSSVTASASANGFSASTTETKYSVTASGTGNYSAKATMTEGYTEGDSKTVTGPVSITDKTIYIKEGAVAANTDTNSGTASATATGFTPSVEATKYKVEATATGSFKVNVNTTEGYVEADTDSVEANYSVTKDTLYIAEASLKNSVADETSYPDKSSEASALISGSYLFIDGGIIEKQKISLAKLVPDGSNVKGSEALMYKTITAYDNDGTLITGTMDDASVSFADSSIALSGAISADGSTYDVTSTDSQATGTVVGGYLKSDATVTANIKATKYSISVFQGEWE